MVTTVTSGRKPWFCEFHLACTAAQTIANASCWPDAKLIAWVLMPDHAHLLLELGPSDVGDYPFWNANWLEPGHHPLDM